MEKLLMKILKNRETVNANKIMSFYEDILWCLETDIDEDYETNQQCIRI